MAIMLVGCSTTPWHEAALYGSKNLTVYENTLRTGYIAIAKEQAERVDWRNAYYFGRKALAVTQTENVMPQHPRERQLPSDEKEDMLNAYYALRLLLISPSFAQYPFELGLAQVQYDCWLEAEEESKLGLATDNGCHHFFIELISLIVDADNEAEARENARYHPIMFQL